MNDVPHVDCIQYFIYKYKTKFHSIASSCVHGIPNVTFMPLHNIELNCEEVAATVNSMNEHISI